MHRSISRRDATVLRFLPLADGLAGRLHRRFPDLLERDDLIQVARLALVQAAARLTNLTTAPAYLKRCISGALCHHLRDRALLVRLPASARGQAPWGHLSLDAMTAHDPGSSGNALLQTGLDCLPAPTPEAGTVESRELERLLDQLPSRQAAALRLTVLEGLSLRQAAQHLGVSAMTVCRCRRQALSCLRQLIDSPAAQRA
ncbi:sigma-70 family RNA polymerase sigma factor [Cyanobium sp. NS01]|uniref:sigma-70 family RNA polymerase sigma factor n=1 Tax=Cyanobium sp. NS01 TaxID=261284 RepID=UPI001645E3F8|nr:sigma-70 family RNA polymerase sigma factor [Cyanobium sp. NS01]QNI71986.1 RNA polymerase sigma factor/ sigma-70 family protein [Cyanobium sp. NS01]